MAPATRLDPAAQPDPQLRGVTVAQLASSPGRARAHVDALVTRVTEDPHEAVRGSAAYVLSTIGTDLPDPVLAQLSARLSLEPSAAVRFQVASALTAAGPRVAPLAEALRQLAQQESDPLTHGVLVDLVRTLDAPGVPLVAPEAIPSAPTRARPRQ